jgi:hypothetical protein
MYGRLESCHAILCQAIFDNSPSEPSRLDYIYYDFISEILNTIIFSLKKKNRKGRTISPTHLLFVDDILLFWDGSLRNANYLKETLAT